MVLHAYLRGSEVNIKRKVWRHHFWNSKMRQSCFKTPPPVSQVRKCQVVLWIWFRSLSLLLSLLLLIITIRKRRTCRTFPGDNERLRTRLSPTQCQPANLAGRCWRCRREGSSRSRRQRGKSPSSPTSAVCLHPFSSFTPFTPTCSPPLHCNSGPHTVSWLPSARPAGSHSGSCAALVRCFYFFIYFFIFIFKYSLRSSGWSSSSTF